MKPWRVCSFYTKNTGYENEIKNLKTSLNKFNIPCYIRESMHLGSWQKNTLYKAKFISQMMDRFPGENIVWVDADAVFRSYPKLFDKIDCDIACHFRNWKHGRDELLSGTLYIGNNNNIRRVIKDWIELNNKKHNMLEQRNLARCIKRYDFRTNVYRLPIEYCTIFDDENRKNIIPVIEHFQASRKYRRKLQ